MKLHNNDGEIVNSLYFEVAPDQRVLYPALNSPLSTLSFTDQYGFRPSGSTTAALIALLHLSLIHI